MKEITCPDCKSKKIVLAGFRYNKLNKKQLRKCKNCNKKFTLDDGFLKMRFKKEHIKKAISLKNKGKSLAAIKDFLFYKYNVKVSRWAIAKWCKKYSSLS